MAGLTIAQRFAAGKVGTPVPTDHFGFSRTTDGRELVSDYNTLATMLAPVLAPLITALTQTLPVTSRAVSYAATHNDVYSMIEFTGAGTQVLSLPTDAAEPLIGVQSVIAFGWFGVGAVTWPVGVVPGTATLVNGVTYDVPLNLTIQKFVTYFWRKRAANEWVLS